MEAAVAAVSRDKKSGTENPHVQNRGTLVPWLSNDPPETWLRVGDDKIQVNDQLKYLGIVLDGRLSFRAHFNTLLPKVEKTATYLGQILPNTFGPGTKTRTLYAEVLKSMTLYGSPVWTKYIGRKESSS